MSDRTTIFSRLGSVLVSGSLLSFLLLTAAAPPSAAQDEYPNYDAGSGQTYRDNSDGSRVYNNNGAPVGQDAFHDLSVGEIRHNERSQINAYQSLRSQNNQRYGGMMRPHLLSQEELTRNEVARYRPACTFTLDPAVEKAYLDSMAAGSSKDPAKRAKSRIFAARCFANGQDGIRKLGLPTNDLAAARLISILCFYQVYNGDHPSTRDALFEMIGFTYFYTAEYTKLPKAPDASKQRFYVALLTEAGMLDYQYGAVVLKKPTEIRLLKDAGEPVLTAAEMRKQAHSMLQTTVGTKTPEDWHFTPTGFALKKN